MQESKPTIVAAPTAKILNLPSPIITFKGRVNGKPELPLCTEWIGQLETYFVTECIEGDHLKISEARRFIDPEVGDAKNVITLPHIREITKWKDLKAELIAIYREKDEEDPYQALSNLIEGQWRPNEDLLGFITRMESLASKYELSHMARTNRTIPKESCRSIIWSKIYKKMPDAKKEIIMKKIDTQRDVTKQVLEFLKDDLRRTPPCALRTLRKDTEVHRSRRDDDQPTVVHMNEKIPPMGNRRDTDDFRIAPYSRDAYKALKKDVEKFLGEDSTSIRKCFNCDEEGHLARNCPNPKTCRVCRKVGHLAKDCWNNPKRRSSNNKENGNRFFRN